MPASFSPFLALRYLKPKRSFVSIITLISVIGVALGVTVLVVVIAVFTGFGVRLKETLLGSQPHVIVNTEATLPGAVEAVGGEPAAEPETWPEIAQRVSELESVVSVTPFTKGQVLLDFGGRRLAPMINGVDPPPGPALERFESMIAEEFGGSFDLSSENAIVGDALARGMGIYVGSTITIYSPNYDAIFEALESFKASEDEDERAEIADRIEAYSTPQDLEVVGIYDTGHHLIDSEIIVPLYIGQELYNLGPHVHGLAVTTTEPYRADLTRDRIREALGYRFTAETWMDRNHSLLSAVAIERNLMYFLLFIIMVVAGFCIMNTMITVTYQKRAEIGLLKAIGATEFQVIRLFLLQGVIVAILGILLGLALAFLLIDRRNWIITFINDKFGIEAFPADVYMLEGGLPAVVTLSDVGVICTGAFIACTVASFLPAWVAARMQPAEALRVE